MISRRLITWLAALGVAPVMAQSLTVSVHEFNDLDGWQRDQHDQALAAFLETCPDLKATDWQTLCAFAQYTDDAKTFFQVFFKPVMIRDGDDAKFTEYFEPEQTVSRVRTSKYAYPIYRVPPEMPKSGVWYSRGELENRGILQNRGLEIAWASDPVDVLFLQIQGSGRLRFTDGRVLRVGYGGANGHQHRSVGQEMVRRGILGKHQASAASIKRWVRANPNDGRAILQHNPSFVFFRELSIAENKGPLGAMNRSLTTKRTVAIDPEYVPLGAPVWIETHGANPLRRLMIGQDTGSVIKGAQRADIFMGSGAAAGQEASKIKDAGSLFVLLPVKRALSLLDQNDP